ncbi:MAG TPA: hypothetical protein DDW52_19835 [Planctomycetaceae bacterium]|nr:hypothetical protein [Planctomycetaceae bacterium]
MGGSLAGSNNLIQDGSSAGAFTATLTGDPMLEPLGKFGGQTLTHRPIVGSPLIGAGTNDAITIDFFDRNGNGSTSEKDPFDQRGAGFPRVVDTTVDIGAVELKFEAFDDTLGPVAEDTGPYEFDVLANDLNPNEDAVVTGVANISPAIVQVTFSGTRVTVTTPQDFFGDISFEYTAASTTSGSDSASVILSVTPVNDAPVAVDDHTETFGETPVAIDVVANDTDVEGDLLFVSSVGTPQNGTAEIVGNWVVYTPIRFTGTDTFTYTVRDQKGETDIGTVTIAEGVQTISFSDGTNGYDGTHDADPYTVDPDEIRNGEVSRVDTDLSGFPNTGRAIHALTRFDDIIGGESGQIPQEATIVSATLTFTIFDSGDFISVHELRRDFDESTTTWNSFGGGIVPGVNATDEISFFDGRGDGQFYHGVRQFDVKPSVQRWVNGSTNFGWGFTSSAIPGHNRDGTNGTDWRSSEAGVSVRPLLRVVYEDNTGRQTVSFRNGVNGYEGTQDVDLVEVEPDSNTNNGAIRVDGETTLDNPAYDRPSHSLLRFDDLFGDAAGKIPLGSEIVSASVALSITDKGDNVRVHNLTVPFDEATVTWNSIGGGVVPGVNASGAFTSFSTSGSGSSIRQFNVTESLQAWVNGAENFGWGLTPSGTDEVEWITSEGEGTSPTLIVQYREPDRTNQDPIAIDDSANTDEDQPVVIGVLANDWDPENDSLLVTITDFGGAQNGDAHLNHDGTVTYVPDLNFHGTDSFRYDISDGQGGTASANVIVTILPQNDAGTFGGDDHGTGPEDGPSITGILTFEDVVDGDSLPRFRIEVGDEATHGNATIDADSGAWSYDSDLNFNGNDSFTVSVTDDDGHVETHAVTITVAPVNDPPVFDSPSSVSVPENDQAVLRLLASDVDLPAQNISFRLADGGADTHLFEIVNDDDLQFIAPADFENPIDAGTSPADNIYEVSVLADDGNGGVTLQRLAVTVTDVEEIPSVESVQVNDGSAQRSMVRSLTVTFDSGVSIDPGAFAISNIGSGSSFTIDDSDIALSEVNGKTIAVLTFGNSSTGIIGGSLADGNYRLTIDATKIRVGVDSMASDHIDEFFRFFGDVDGDRDVDAFDFRAFRKTYRKSYLDADFNSLFDFEGDGDVDAFDFREFRSRYRNSI